MTHTGEYDISALHLAALHGHIDTVERLVMMYRTNIRAIYVRNSKAFFKEYNVKFIPADRIFHHTL